jgi:predicted dienelactone hydrolase
MRRSLLIIALWVLVVMPAAASARSGETVSLGGKRAVMWSAVAPAPAKQPVIIFSHGFRGNPRQSGFLLEALAAAGYLVLAPYHQDARERGDGAGRLARLQEKFRKPEKWSDQTYRDRAEDIRQLVAALQTDPRFRDQADLGHLGLVGHSLGGYTVLGLAGAWPDWRLNGVRAVLALSPYTQPFLTHRTLGGLTAPVMYQGGAFDFGITPALRRPQGAYDRTRPPKYYVEFSGAGHLAWTDLRTSQHQQIIAYSRAFLDHYVKGLPAAKALTQRQQGVAVWRYDSELGSGNAATGLSSEQPSRARRLRP